MVNPAKANQREKEIDVARCKGAWDAIPELARKFRKHSAAGIVLEQTALAEYTLVKAIEKTEKEKGFGEESYDNDTPDNITLPPTVDESLVKDVFTKLEVALSQASGQERECIETLDTEFVPQNLPSGYNFVLIIQGLTIGGMAREALEDNDGAIACYDQIVILLAQKSGEKAEQLIYWSEEALYRASLLKVRLGAGESNWRVLEFVDQVMSDWELLNRGTASEMKGLTDMLYRATQKTFQSPKILRHLLNTLITLGDYEEAELAINAYVSIVEKGRETRKDVIEDASTPLNKYTIESTENIVQSLISGSELMAKHLNKSKEALELAQKAVAWCENGDSDVDNELLAQAWRYVGVGYSLVAREERDPDRRPDLHASAVDAFTKSSSFDSNAFETHYSLALEHAITRDIGQASTSVRQALVLDSTSIPCWHLLVLLMSSQKDIKGALKACEVGANESDWETADSSVDYSTLTAIGIDDGEEFIAFKLTQNTLQELLYGSDVAIQNSDKLFALYTKVFPDYGPGSPSDSIHDTLSSRKNYVYEEALTPTNPKVNMSTTSVRSSSSVAEKKEGNNSAEGSISGLYIGNKDTLDVPKANYAPSIASSRNSASSRRSPTPTIAGLSSSKSIMSSVQQTHQMHQTLKTKLRRQRAAKALSDLWLFSASAFRRLGNLEEAQKAIESAEDADCSNPDVWCQFGILLFLQGQSSDAITSFHKALAIDDQHVPTLVHLARTYLENDNIEMAESLLEDVTKSNGWDCAEAWLHLGKIFQVTNRIKRSKDCLWYALDLEETNPIRPFSVLPVCL
ncbi:13023_t:CDS:10 [Acaulospora colombiana]|uniref:13023_t:CDS:1 n=1 Tax=Acaulospora colombiana TaxID=27376 RepID=A0ACA9LIA1_9GLOM|nr:13023_t:CDS:10 [Acaulospora colombiana]